MSLTLTARHHVSRANILVAALVAVGWGLAAAAERPRLQIINGGPEPVDVFWIERDEQRVPQGTVPPGEDTVITTTIGHRFVIVGSKDDTEHTVTSMVPIQAYRVGGVPGFYTQRVEVNGFPIVASDRVNPYALKEAAHLVGLMIAERPDLCEALVTSGARMNILAWNEFTTDQPEFERMGRRPATEFPGMSGKDYPKLRSSGTFFMILDGGMIVIPDEARGGFGNRRVVKTLFLSFCSERCKLRSTRMKECLDVPAAVHAAKERQASHVLGGR